MTSSGNGRSLRVGERGYGATAWDSGGGRGRKGIRDVVGRDGETAGCEGFWLPTTELGRRVCGVCSFRFIVRIGPFFNDGMAEGMLGILGGGGVDGAREIVSEAVDVPRWASWRDFRALDDVLRISIGGPFSSISGGFGLDSFVGGSRFGMKFRWS